MLDKKFYAVEGDLVHNVPGEYLQSVLLKYNVPFIHQYVALLTCIDKWPTWHNSGICLLDYRHAAYEDFIFTDYVKSLLDSGIETIRVSDEPFGYEMWGTDYRDQLNQLRHRTEILFNQTSQSGRPVILVSPSIRRSNEDIAGYYLDYFRECGDMFDIFSVTCDIDGTDRELGVLAGLLTQILALHDKPVWVTKWCIPSYDDKISPAHIGSISPQIQRTKVAAARLKHVFQSINMIVPGSQWFLTGAGKDFYIPNGRPSQFVLECPFLPSDNWSNMNFMGMVNWNGTPKFHVIQSVVEILKEYV